MKLQLSVTCLEHSSLLMASIACRMSHDNHDKSDTLPFLCDKAQYESGAFSGVEFKEKWGISPDVYRTQGPKDRALIERVGNKLKHASILEQLVYFFDIDGISRGCLQELARHRTARLTVKSSRYTLNDLKDEPYFMNGWCHTDSLQEVDWNENGYERASNYLVMTGDSRVDLCSIGALDNIISLLRAGISNDKVKFALPESFKTRLIWQIDGRNLQNFLQLRTAKDALWEIRILANEIYLALPEEHRYLYEASLSEDPISVPEWRM